MFRLKIGVIDELLEARYHAKSQSWMTYRIRDDGKIKSVFARNRFATKEEAEAFIRREIEVVKELSNKPQTEKGAEPVPAVGKKVVPKRGQPYWKYTCRICGKEFVDRYLNEIDDSVCQRCFTGGQSKDKNESGQKRRVIRKGEFPGQHL